MLRQVRSNQSNEVQDLITPSAAIRWWRFPLHPHDGPVRSTARQRVPHRAGLRHVPVGNPATADIEPEHGGFLCRPQLLDDFVYVNRLWTELQLNWASDTRQMPAGDVRHLLVLLLVPLISDVEPNARAGWAEIGPIEFLIGAGQAIRGRICARRNLHPLPQPLWKRIEWPGKGNLPWI